MFDEPGGVHGGLQLRVPRSRSTKGFDGAALVVLGSALVMSLDELMCCGW